MASKKAFIEMIESVADTTKFEKFPEGLNYWNQLKASNEKLTENGQLVLDAMKNMEGFHTSAEIAEVAGVSSRTAAGAMRKLVDMGLVEKDASASPAKYSLV